MALPRFIESGGRYVSLETAEGKELAKWEKPYRYEPYPKMLYRAQQAPGSGKWAVSAVPPSQFGFHDVNEWDRACQAADAFTRSCQMIVSSEAEHKAALQSGEGWRNTPAEAMEFVEKLQAQIGEAAAHGNYVDRNMSEAAKAEKAAAEAEHFGHLPEIPEKPKRRGRTPRSAAA